MVFSEIFLMNEKQPETTSSLLDELDDINDLLDTAISKAKNLDQNPNLNSYGSTYVEEVVSEKIDIVDTTVKPSGWDNIKNSALEESLSTFEEKEKELAKNTKQARSITPNKKVKLDDNWDDDPF